MKPIRIARPEDIGALLKGYRRERLLAQTELAKKIGVSQRWISHAESGKPTLQLGLVLRVLNELGVELTADIEEPARAKPTKSKRVTSIDNIVDD